MPIEEQAIYLENQKKYKLAIKKYIALNNYPKIIELSRLAHDYKSLFIYQVKNNQLYEAMQTAEIYELYELGAPLCEKEGALIKAAHMYYHYDLVKAANAYKQAEAWDKAANCYINVGQYIRALDCMEQVQSKNIKSNLYNKLLKIGEELYKNKNYEEAIKLYVRINNLEKALDISKEIKDEKTSLMLYENLAKNALDNNDLEKAPFYFEAFDLSRAFTLYMKNQDLDNAVRILIQQEKLEEAIHLYLKNGYEDKAIQLVQNTNKYNFLLNFYKEKKNYEKISWIYDITHEIKDAIEYFKNENQLERVVYFAKQLRPVKTAEILKEIKYYEQAAHYYLLEDNKEECENCLKLSGKTPKEIEDYFFIKNYPA